MNTRITFYPVDNGDCNLLEIENGPQMMWDCRFRTSAEDENDESKYDVITDLLDNKLKRKVSGLPFLEAFVLTHADMDHCLGFDKKFYLGDPDKISNQDKSDKKILIGELWYSPRVIIEHKDELSEPAKAFKKEAERRMYLYKKDKHAADKDGNRIRIIGWVKEDKLDGLEERVTTPGNEICEVNGIERSNFRMFIHAPFKDDIKIENENRNETSLVMQIRIDSGNKKNAGKIVLGGDSEWRVWEKIMNLSEDESLRWDIFEAPHHCSWSFFGDDREKDQKPSKSSIDFLDKRENNACVVSSSKYISHMDSNPPCKRAKNHYVNEIGEENFFCTGGNKNGDTPAPVVFELQNNGFHLLKDNNNNNKVATAIATNSKNQPHVYG